MPEVVNLQEAYKIKYFPEAESFREVYLISFHYQVDRN
jgi:hypothetical protein